MARSKELAPGVGRYSRSRVFAKRGLFKGMKKSEPKPAAETPAHKEVQVKGDKNGGTRLVPTAKAPRFYPADDVRQPKKSRKTTKPTKLRPSITPGTVLILLAGRFRGKRAVFLKQLDSGLLLVTGPYKVNGVPLRRVAQAYVIATSTKVDLGELKVCSGAHRIHFGFSSGFRLTRSSTTPTSPSHRRKRRPLRKRNSSLRASRRRRRHSPSRKRLIRRRLTRPSLPLSPRQKTLENI
jgi:hypothetical protein